MSLARAIPASNTPAEIDTPNHPFQQPGARPIPPKLQCERTALSTIHPSAPETAMVIDLTDDSRNPSPESALQWSRAPQPHQQPFEQKNHRETSSPNRPKQPSSTPPFLHIPAGLADTRRSPARPPPQQSRRATKKETTQQKSLDFTTPVLQPSSKPTKAIHPRHILTSAEQGIELLSKYHPPIFDTFVPTSIAISDFDPDEISEDSLGSPVRPQGPHRTPHTMPQVFSSWCASTMSRSCGICI